MKSLINFYQNLDTFNLVMFWSITILLLILLILAIIITIKNRKLKKKTSNNARINKPVVENSQKDNENELPIINENKPKEPDTPIVEESNEPIEEEKFVAEEHVIAYDNNLFSLPNIEKVTNYEEPKLETEPTGPYQKNSNLR